MSFYNHNYLIGVASEIAGISLYFYWNLVKPLNIISVKELVT